MLYGTNVCICFVVGVSAALQDQDKCGKTVHLDRHSSKLVLNSSIDFPWIWPGVCDWYIYSPTNTNIVLEFQQLSLEYGYWLYVFDSQGRDLLRTRGLKMVPFPVISDNAAHIQFDAEDITWNAITVISITYTGFVITDTV